MKKKNLRRRSMGIMNNTNNQEERDIKQIASLIRMFRTTCF